ncbi:MAG TPA: hypothetical protein VFV95_19795 [Vicinamibacterales bacterium]|nr:hypothetical protein [Vicinamibacterales bacterium]
MRGLVVATFIPLAVAVAAGQEKPTAKPSEAAQGTLTGCVSAKPDVTGVYTLTQSTTGGRFRLTGKSVRGFAGKQVEIVIASGKGLSIRGGLMPSVNVAAQAGHIDAAQAAIASQPGANTGKSDAELPELKVDRVREVSATCK